MHTHSQGKLRLLALNLALVLVFGTLLPTAALAAEEQQVFEPDGAEVPAQLTEISAKDKIAEQPLRTEDGSADLMAAAYHISVGSTGFWSDEDRSGSGWTYNSGSGVLMLDGGYSGGHISASGDLQVYTRGNVSIQGRNSNYTGGDAITVEGMLRIINVNGMLTLRGGSTYGYFDPNSKWQPEGGSAIDAEDGLFYIAIDGSLSATGGAAPHSLAGAGVHSYNGPVIFGALERTKRYADGWESYAGRLGTPEVQISGGCGLAGGDAISAMHVSLDLDGTVSGGEGENGKYGRYSVLAGHALYCHSYHVGNLSNEEPQAETAVSLKLESGGKDVNAVMAPSGRDAEETLFSDHIEKKTSWATPHTLTFYPKSYNVELQGRGGDPTGADTAFTVSYPAGVDLSVPAFRQDGQYLYAYYDKRNRRTIMSHETEYIPAENASLTARWAPYGADSVLFLGNYGQIRGDDYLEEQLGWPFTAPFAENSAAGFEQMLGWCGTAAPDWNESTGMLGEDALWLSAGSVAAADKPAIFWAQWSDPEYAMIRYHGNGGLRENGSDLAVKTTRATDSDLKLYVGADQGFSREGYTFEGWTDGELGGQTVSPEDFASGKRQLDLYAQWKEIVIEDVSDRMTLTGSLTLPAQQMPVPLQTVLGELRIDGQPPRPEGRVTYLVDGAEVRPDALLTELRPYSLTVQYSDRFTRGEKTFRIDEIGLDFNTIPGSRKTFIAVYDRSKRMISVIDAGGTGKTVLPWSVYDRMKHADLFFLTQDNEPAAGKLTIQHR